MKIQGIYIFDIGHSTSPLRRSTNAHRFCKCFAYKQQTLLTMLNQERVRKFSLVIFLDKFVSSLLANVSIFVYLSLFYLCF